MNERVSNGFTYGQLTSGQDRREFIHQRLAGEHTGHYANCGCDACQAMRDVLARGNERDLALPVLEAARNLDTVMKQYEYGWIGIHAFKVASNEVVQRVREFYAARAAGEEER